MWNKGSIGGLSSSKKVKIKLFDTHFAWIYQSLLKRFDEMSGYVNRTEWIKEKVKEEFGLILKEKADLLVLDDLVKKGYYIDKTDWLREKMREEIKKEMEQRYEI